MVDLLHPVVNKFPLTQDVRKSGEARDTPDPGALAEVRVTKRTV
jgi:hypothetical protein